MDFPDFLRSIPEQVPEEATAIGFVPRDDAGQILVVEPKGQRQGVSATFPKVQMRDQDSADSALGRCRLRRTGANHAQVVASGDSVADWS